jgi:hypothetical protein
MIAARLPAEPARATLGSGSEEHVETPRERGGRQKQLTSFSHGKHTDTPQLPLSRITLK